MKLNASLVRKHDVLKREHDVLKRNILSFEEMDKGKLIFSYQSQLEKLAEQVTVIILRHDQLGPFPEKGKLTADTYITELM